MTVASIVRRIIPKATTPAAVAVLVLGTAAASAQTYYGGYNLGPDYGAMLAQMQRQQMQMNQQMQATHAQIVQRTMQDPNCQAMYRQHRAGGGQLSFEQFAAQYAATGGFSQEGIARYRASENRNIANEQAAFGRLQQAQRERAGAQANYMESYGRNQAEAGRVLQGQSSWTNPTNGQNYALNYMGPAVSYDPTTGQHFARDTMGNQWAQTPYGQWVPMTPAR